ncbi:hypothetical protein ACP4OV_006343 [Aristida adscensionis]
MRTEMVIRMKASSEKGHAKAMKVAAAIDGVESVTLAGGDKSLLLVVGDGVDCNHLTSRLRRKVGHADVVQLRTLQDRAAGYYGGSHAVAPARDAGYYGGRSHAVDPARDAGYSHYGSYAPASEYYHQRQPSYEYAAAAPPYGATVVHHEYYPAAADPNSCSIM